MVRIIASRTAGTRKAFRCEVNKRDDIRMPFSSENDAKNKLFNIVYAYNAVKEL